MSNTKLNAANVTDQQIKTLGSSLVSEGRYSAAMWCDYALIAAGDNRYDIPSGCDYVQV